MRIRVDPDPKHCLKVPKPPSTQNSLSALRHLEERNKARRKGNAALDGLSALVHKEEERCGRRPSGLDLCPDCQVDQRRMEEGNLIQIQAFCILFLSRESK